MLRFLYHCFQAVLSLFWGVCILISIVVFAAIGFAGGIFLACWEDVRGIDLDRLEYNVDTETWRQHLEVYSSVCEVQKADKIAFLVDKLNRLEYKRVAEIIPRLSEPGEYAETLNAQGNRTVRIHLRDFEYPYLDVEAGHVQISVRDGKITDIRGGDGAVRQNFYLEPEMIAEFADDQGSTRRLIPLLQMPTKLTGAFIAIEDHRFANHWGIDVIRLAGAVKNTVVHGSRLAGTSTLTQQLARNIYLFNQRSKRSVVRKTREILLAVRIEKVFSKDEILERYLNHVDLGRSRYGGKTFHGVQQGALGYFGKEVSELDYHECALLAALPKGPFAFSPFSNPDDAKYRRDIVLDRMLAEEYIPASEWLVGRNAPLLPPNLDENRTRIAAKEAGHFLEYIREELVRLPELKDKLYSDGLKVYTTIDMSMQAVAEREVAKHLRYMDKTYAPRSLPDYDANKRNPHGVDPINSYLQAALIAFEPKTGHVKAMVGGRDYHITETEINYYNRAIGSARRQPGSAFKPIIFAALLEDPSIITPATVIPDKRWGIVPFPGQKTWYPRNYTERFRGNVTMRDVLTKSINVPTARAVLETPIGDNGIWEGINRVVDLTKRMGIKSPMDPKPALSLGASGMTVLELTSAYGIFANGGIQTQPVHIQYILDTTGTVIYPSQDHQVERARVLDEKIAYQITTSLENVIQNGSGRRAKHIMGMTRSAAGKTGTTNDNVDAWFVGYTTDLVVGVWVGFDKNRSSRRNYNQEGAKAALPIWAQFVIDAARGPHKEFPVPEGIVFRDIDKKSGLLKRVDCPEENIHTEAFIEGQQPNSLCNLQH